MQTTLSSLIPGGVSSPLRAFPGLGVEPLVVQRAAGDTLYNRRGESWVDYCCSCGALMLGHAHPAVVEAAKLQMERGSAYWFVTEMEEQLAEKLVQHLGGVEQVRYVCSGTEATMTAARIARGATSRELIVKFKGCYHGHADLFLHEAGSGIAQLDLAQPRSDSTLTLPYNDTEAVQRLFESHGDQIAGVIVEPIVGNMGVVPGDPQFLETLRTETEKGGALLIFDEVYTGFRVGIGGAQGLYGIDPDLTTLGKIVGGGFPLAVVGGKERFMSLLAPVGPVYQAGTMSANPVALAAALATLEQLEAAEFYQTLEGRMVRFAEPIEQEIARRGLPACLQRVGSMWSLFLGPRQVQSFAQTNQFDEASWSALFRHLYREGVVLSPSQYEAHFVSGVHTEAHLQRLQSLLLDYISEWNPCGA